MLPFILVCDGSLILHVRMPDTEMPHPNPSERAKYASKELNDYTENEIDVLRTLTESGCSAAPKLLSWTRELQDETMWVPGGYVVYILMEKLPGAPPFNFWVEKDLSLEDRDTVRKGFRAALRYAIIAYGHQIKFNSSWQRGQTMWHYSHG